MGTRLGGDVADRAWKAVSVAYSDDMGVPRGEGMGGDGMERI